MMKHSIVALFSVLTCIVYGQFLGNWNHDLHGFRPYVAHSPSALSNSANLPIGAQQYDTDQQPEMRNLLVLTKLALLDKNYRKLAEELRTNISDAKQQITDLTSKLANTTQALEKAETELADIKSSLTSVKVDLQNATETLKQTTTDLANTNTNVEDFSLILQDVALSAAETSVALDSFKKDQTDFNANITARVVDLEGKINGSTGSTGSSCTCDADSATVLAEMPISCADLSQLGYKKSGLFSVMGSQHVETVYCDFTKGVTDPAIQTRIGYQDVKSQSIYFSARDYDEASTLNAPLFTSDYVLIDLNIGNALNEKSGIFTAPVKGIYFFSFTGKIVFLADYQKPKLQVAIMHNNQMVSSAYRNDDGDIPPAQNPGITVNMQATLQLQQGDQVWCSIEMLWGAKIDPQDGATQFQGWLVEQQYLA